MKVYVKKGECQPMIVGILATLGFLAFSLTMFITTFSEYTFIEGLNKNGMGLVFATIFFIFSMYFIFGLFKPPKRFSAKLISKETQIYNGNNIYYMKFRVFKKEKRYDDMTEDVYGCYTYDDLGLLVENIYDVYIKEFNWKIRSVGERQDDKIITAPTSNMKPVFIAVGFIILANIAAAIAGLIFYKDWTVFYIIWLILFSFVFVYLIKFYIQYENDNKESSSDIPVDLSKYKTLTGEKIINKNLIIQDLLKEFIIIPTIWFIIVFFLNNFQFNYELMMVMCVALFPMGVILLLMLYYKNFDKRLIKKHGLNIEPIEDIKNISSIRIFRPSKEVNFEKFYIVDSKNNNLIYKVQKVGLIKKKYIVCQNDNKMIAEIKNKLFSFGIHYIVRPLNMYPYSVRLKLSLQHNYQISGLDGYVLNGDTSGLENNILNNNGDVIASVRSSNSIGGWYSLGDTELELNNVENNKNIILLALCITMGNLDYSRKRMYRD